MLLGFVILVLGQCQGEPYVSFPDERYGSVPTTIQRTGGYIVFDNGQKFVVQKGGGLVDYTTSTKPKNVVYAKPYPKPTSSMLAYVPVVVPAVYRPLLPVQTPNRVHGDDDDEDIFHNSPHFPYDGSPDHSKPKLPPGKPESPAVGTKSCQCMTLDSCVSKNNSTSTRITINFEISSACPSNQVYCCMTAKKLGCGIPNIIPGVNPTAGQAHLGQNPWTAIILTLDDLYVGGGALIEPLHDSMEPMHVLTVAHRIFSIKNPQSLKIRLGDWDLSNEFEPVKHVEYKITKITYHPGFDSKTLKNDIAIITLAAPVPTFTEPHPQINSICLPDPSDTFIGMRCKVAGWGKDRFNGNYQSIIKEVDVPVLSPYECQNKMRATPLGNAFVLDTNSFLCAGGEYGKDACTGDGGNALACPKNGKYVAAGLTAAGIECGYANVPGLYVNLVNYVQWIKMETKKDEEHVVNPRTNHQDS